MTGWNLPPGCTNADIERAQGQGDDGDACLVCMRVIRPDGSCGCPDDYTAYVYRVERIAERVIAAIPGSTPSHERIGTMINLGMSDEEAFAMESGAVRQAATILARRVAPSTDYARNP